MYRRHNAAVSENLEYRENQYEHGERGACGIGAVIDRERQANNTVVQLALEGLCDLDVRGAGIEGTGDGAGIMLRTAGLRRFLEQFIPAGTLVPEREPIHVGNFFMHRSDRPNLPLNLKEIAGILRGEGIHVVGFRTSGEGGSFEVDDSVLGARGRETMPLMAQVLFTPGFQTDGLRQALHQAKLKVSANMRTVHAVSLEEGVATYKAMSSGKQLRRFYGDFKHPDFKTDAAAWHVRFATNTRSVWPNAQGFRHLNHNGEINTISAIRPAVRNLERELRLPNTVLMHQGSDSGDLDRLVTLLHAHGIPLSESVRRIFLPTPDDRRHMSDDVQMYYRAVRRAMGPLSAAEGPAGIVAMDKDELVASLDGLGLRPLRVIETTDGLIIVTSEIGAPHIPLDKVKTTYQLDAGEMAVVRKDGTLLMPGESDGEIVRKTQLNYKELGNGTVIDLAAYGSRTAARETREAREKDEVLRRWNLFGGNRNLHYRVSSMANAGKEPVLGMGDNMPLAVFSRGHPRLNAAFHQIVAVVTNPPMDPIREGDSMDTKVYLGRRPVAHEHGHTYKPQPHAELSSPVLTEDEYLNLVEHKPTPDVPFSAHRIDTIVREGSEQAMKKAINEIVRAIVKIARRKEHSVIVLSDRAVQEGEIYIPPALIVAAAHNELIKFGLRRNVSLVCDTGEAFEAHDIAVLVSMGANAVNPYLMWQAADAGAIEGKGKDATTLKKNLKTTFDATLKRVMSKMGITSVEGYCGARLMHAVGIDPSLMAFYFQSPVSDIGGMTLKDIVEDMVARSNQGESLKMSPDDSGWDKSIRELLESVSYGHDDPRAAFQEFIAAVRALPPVYLRDLLELTVANADQQVPLSDVMPARELFEKHIRGTAMSHGALTGTAHRALAAAFNELGGMSNSGEGGELKSRNRGGELEADRSKIRQVASARFSVDAEYLVNADELEIKIGQGAKPGEGGHLPGFKVGPIIAHMRHTQVGIDLISPPPQHDLYSIEDLARLISDLRAVNPDARISVKLTANTDLGTVAVGVAKAGADVIGISGWEGGTGAAVSSALEHTGLPLELSLAEVHQALVASNLREYVKLRADGGLKAPDDIIKLACMGADEFGLGSALVIAGERCIMCRSCSGQAERVIPGTFKECPTGIMPVTKIGALKLGLGARKAKESDFLGDEGSYEVCKHATKHYLELLAEGVRERLAELGKKNIEEITGDTTLLRQVSRTPQADRVNLGSLLKDVRPERIAGQSAAIAANMQKTIEYPAVNAANQDLLDAVMKAAQEGGEQTSVRATLATRDRTFGGTLAGKIAKGEIAVPKDGIAIETDGYAGQSYAFCNVEGVTFEHLGFANDFVSAGQSGGKVVIRQPEASYRWQNSVAGNACAYGATGGLAYFNGAVGQRFGVRNSGATLVAEKTGKYGAEYMTGGTVVVLRKAGKEFGTGSTGGKNYVRDKEGTLAERLSKDVMITGWTARDRAELRSLVEDYERDTSSTIAKKILDDPSRFESIKRVVPKDHYVNAVASVLSYSFYRLEDAPSVQDVIENAVIELCAYAGSDENDGEVRRMITEKIAQLKPAFEGAVQERLSSDKTLHKDLAKQAPYWYEFAHKFARQFVESLPKKATAEAGLRAVPNVA